MYSEVRRNFGKHIARIYHSVSFTWKVDFTACSLSLQEWNSCPSLLFRFVQIWNSYGIFARIASQTIFFEKMRDGSCLIRDRWTQLIYTREKWCIPQTGSLGSIQALTRLWLSVCNKFLYRKRESSTRIVANGVGMYLFISLKETSLICSKFHK